MPAAIPTQPPAAGEAAELVKACTEVTEAQVIAFFRERVKRLVLSTPNNLVSLELSFGIHHDGEEQTCWRTYSGADGYGFFPEGSRDARTAEEAISALVNFTPKAAAEAKATELRSKAAKLLEEADKLAPQPSTTESAT